MPILRLLDRHTGKFSEASFVDEVLPVMICPSDAGSRLSVQLHLRHVVASLREDRLKQLGVINPGTLHPLQMDLLQWIGELGGVSALGQSLKREDFESQARMAEWRGRIAGDILIFVLWIEKEGYGGSVRKAKAVVRRHIEKHATKVGPRYGKTERFIERAWSEYRPAAHLWAANRMLAGGIFPPQSVDEAGIQKFLSLARRLLSLGVNHRSQGQRSTLLDAATCWSIPVELELEDASIDLQEMPAFALEELREQWPKSVPPL